MKDTGIVRRVDDLGRVALPRELRRVLHIQEGDALKIWIDGDVIAFRKYEQPSPLRTLENLVSDIQEFGNEADAAHIKDIQHLIDKMRGSDTHDDA